MAADKFGVSKAHPDRQHVAEVEAVYEAVGVDGPVEPSGTGSRQHIHLDRAISGEAQQQRIHLLIRVAPGERRSAIAGFAIVEGAPHNVDLGQRTADPHRQTPASSHGNGQPQLRNLGLRPLGRYL